MLSFDLNLNYLGYTEINKTIFRANISEIFGGTSDLVILEDIMALSPEVRKIKDNSTIYGYNSSWLWENNTFMTGRIPENMHSPLFYDGKDGGPDCTTCHGVKDVGVHKLLNNNAASKVGDENKPCWACHGDGNEPRGHPQTCAMD